VVINKPYQLTRLQIRIQYIVFLILIFSQALCNFEENIYNTISKDWQVKPVTYFMKGVSFVSTPAFDAVSPLALYICKKDTVAKHGLIGFLGNCATVFSLKYLVNRQRPEGEYSRWDSSFPSGHTTFTFSQAVIYSHHCPKLKVPLFLYAATVGFARIYLAKHYPTDVIAGAALGVLTGYLTVKLFE
jgi:membrane-associated phospholipid phosphatase